VKSSRFLISISLILALAGLILIMAGPVLADAPSSGILKGVECAGSGAPVDFGGENTSVYKAAKICDLCDFVQVAVNVSDLIISISGVLAILIFIYAGLMYLTVSVKPDNAAKAKSAISAAVIGLVLIFGAYAIINFVLMTFVGGESNMNLLYEMTGQGSEGWGVCKPPSSGTSVNNGSQGGVIEPTGSEIYEIIVP